MNYWRFHVNNRMTAASHKKTVLFFIYTGQLIQFDLHLWGLGGLSFSTANGIVRPPPSTCVLRLTLLSNKSCSKIPGVVHNSVQGS